MVDGNTYRKKEYSLKSRIDLLEKLKKNLFLFCMMTYIPTVKVNYILDAQKKKKISKKFENRTKKTLMILGNM